MKSTRTTLGEQLTALLIKKRPNIHRDPKALQEATVALATLLGCVVAGDAALEISRRLQTDGRQTDSDLISKRRTDAAVEIVMRTIARTLEDIGRKLEQGDTRSVH